MKIIELQAENVKRLRAVEIRPDGTLQVIGGRNAQGKSSVLDAIWLALGGGKAGKETTLPIRDGESRASVTLDLGYLVVARSWTQKGTSLKVTSKDGAVYGSPQKMLDELVGRLSFDPLEFTRLSAREQRDALLDLADLDVDMDALEAERAEVFAQRTEVGRQGKAIGDVQVDDDLPDTERSAQDFIARIRESEAHNRRADDAMSDYEAAAREVEQTEARVDSLRQQLNDAEESLYSASQRAEMRLKTAQTFVKVDVSPLEDELESVEELNQQIRANNAAREKAQRKAVLAKEWADLSDQISELDHKKALALASAAFPVPGLGFDEQGVTFQGVPFSQASSAERIRVSVAMAMALNPKLRVLRIKDGSLLDEDTLAAIREQVKEQDFQLWLERVGDADEGAIIIEDGQVQAV